MGCGCKRGRVQADGTRIVGYYVVLPGGAEIPKVSQGAKPYSTHMEAQVEVRRHGGGSIYPVKKKVK